MPNLSDFTKKIDLQGIVDSVKSAIGSQTAPAKAPEGDEIAAKFVELITTVQNLMSEHEGHTKSLNSLAQKLNTLYKEVQTFRETAGSAARTIAESVPSSTVFKSESNSESPTTDIDK